MVRNRKKLFLIGALILLASLVPVAFMLQPSAADLLTQALLTMEDITDGHAVVELHLNTPEKSGDAIVELWGRLGTDSGEQPAFRIEVLEASEDKLKGSMAVSNGSDLWLWHASENTVYLGTVDELKAVLAEKLAGKEFDHAYTDMYSDADIPETAEEAVASLLEYFTAERKGAIDIAGTAAHEIRLIPIAEKVPDEVRAAGGYINVWIGAESSAPLGVEYAEGVIGDAKAVATTLELNAGIADAVFEFQIPEDATVIRLVDLATLAMSEWETKSGTLSSGDPDSEILTPAYLPSGAKLIDTSQIRGATVHRYSLAQGKSFTIAQGPLEISYQPEGADTTFSVRGVEGILYTNDNGTRTMLAWVEENRGFWVGGDLEVDELSAIAESLH